MEQRENDIIEESKEDQSDFHDMDEDDDLYLKDSVDEQIDID